MRILILVLLLVSSLYGFESGKYYSVVPQGKNFEIKEGSQVEGALAWGVFVDDVVKDGWGKLTLRSSGFKTQLQAYAIGFLEGALTSKYIYYHKINFFDQIFKGNGPSQKIVDYFQQQEQFTRENIAAYAGGDLYWRSIGLFQAMLDGMVAGYDSVSDQEKKLSALDFQILQAIGDMFDLMPALEPTKKLNWFNLDGEEFSRQFLMNNHCSALIKIKEDFSDVFMGHTSWNSGQVMLRTYKFYKFGDDLDIQLSGYPGQIYSLDDYYILNRPEQKMFVTETTHSNVF